MSPARQMRIWLVVAVLFFLAVWLLSDILLPFVAGMAIAYFLDPVCDRLERAGLSRTLATVLVTAIFVILLLAVIGVAVPVLVGELLDFAERLPAIWDAARRNMMELVQSLEARMGASLVTEAQRSLSGSGDKVFGWAAEVLGKLVSGGAALVNLASLVFITPVVTFFLLRDWDRMVAKIDGLLPRQHADTIRDLARQVDATLAGFVRGQATVCLILGTFYALGLTLVGLEFGLLIGLMAGLISFIPFVGAIVGLVASVGLALIQFDDWTLIAATAGIFFAGQAIEGNFLTPKLVGDRVGLHPVWVIFGLLAGGSLFGFVGVLLSVPVAAIIGVGVRFALARYRASQLYGGGDRQAAASARRESGSGSEEKCD